MEITRSNFKDKYEMIERTIKESTFLAIDGEFTGLNEEYNLNLLDTSEGRYEKLKDGSMQFLMIQFGLCAFKYHPEDGTYSYKPFNFYVFPKSIGKNDLRFTCQTSSLHFLAEQGFDFNKLILDGIPYLTKRAEQKLRENFINKHAMSENKFRNEKSEPKTAGDSEQPEKECCSPEPKEKDVELSTPKHQQKSKKTNTPGDKVQKEHKNFINDTHAKILEFNSSCKDGDALTIPSCSNYRRKLVYEMVENEFGNDSGLEIKTEIDDFKNRYLRVTKTSVEAQLQHLKEQLDNDLQSLDDDVGFSKVIQAISQSGKTVVGHNMLLDVMHTVDQFYEPLPPTLNEFKSFVNDVLPTVIDTKVIATTKPFSELIEFSGLNQVFQRVQKSPFSPAKVVKDPDFDGDYTTDEEKLHEAGYDAYITGLCFLSLMKHLEDLSEPLGSNKLEEHALVKPFLNKVFMARSSDIPYINFSGTDIMPRRDHVFHVSFPKEYKTQDIIQLFSCYGPVFVTWINDQTAFVSLKNVNQAKNAMALTKECRARVKVIKYEEFVSLGKAVKRPSTPDNDSQPAAKKARLSTERKAFEEDNDYA